MSNTVTLVLSDNLSEQEVLEVIGSRFSTTPLACGVFSVVACDSENAMVVQVDASPQNTDDTVTVTTTIEETNVIFPEIGFDIYPAVCGDSNIIYCNMVNSVIPEHVVVSFPKFDLTLQGCDSSSPCVLLEYAEIPSSPSMDEISSVFAASSRQKTQFSIVSPGEEGFKIQIAK